MCVGGGSGHPLLSDQRCVGTAFLWRFPCIHSKRNLITTLEDDDAALATQKRCVTSVGVFVATQRRIHMKVSPSTFQQAGRLPQTSGFRLRENIREGMQRNVANDI